MKVLGVLVVAAALTGGWQVSARASSDPPDVAPFLVGTASVSIAPTFPYVDGPIYVGGVIPGPIRPANGNWDDTRARAVAITDADGKGVVLGEVDIQGAFASVKQGDFGLDHAAQVAARELGIDPSQIIVGSSHTHAGADIMGLWGGSPASYLRDVHDRVVHAVVAAWRARRPATLDWAATRAPELLTNQSDWQGMDDQLRVLTARDPETAQPIAILPNWQGHPSLVPGNKLHADWVGELDKILEARNAGAFAMSFVGAVGHTQTNAGGNTDQAVGVQKAIAYASKLADLLEPLELHPVAPGPVEAAAVFFTETVVNPLAIGLEHAGPDRVVTLYRSDEPPWLDGTTLGARVAAVRIGDLLLGAAPGEAYPWIHWSLRDFAVGPEGTIFFMGLAGDTLGYLVAPSELIPHFATDVNDNEVLLLSTTMGDHVMCALVQAASALGFGVTEPDGRCAAWPADELTYAG